MRAVLSVHRHHVSGARLVLAERNKVGARACEEVDHGRVERSSRLLHRIGVDRKTTAGGICAVLTALNAEFLRAVPLEFYQLYVSTVPGRVILNCECLAVSSLNGVRSVILLGNVPALCLALYGTAVLAGDISSAVEIFIVYLPSGTDGQTASIFQSWQSYSLYA